MTIQVRGGGSDGEGSRGAGEAGSMFPISFGGRSQRTMLLYGMWQVK